jgi:hypothetical protein
MVALFIGVEAVPYGMSCSPERHRQDRARTCELVRIACGTSRCISRVASAIARISNALMPTARHALCAVICCPVGGLPWIPKQLRTSLLALGQSSRW